MYCPFSEDAVFEFSMKEDAVDPSYTIFFLGACQKRLFCYLRLGWDAAGCITILQAQQSNYL
jgi:hypothetical protein